LQKYPAATLALTRLSDGEAISKSTPQTSEEVLHKNLDWRATRLLSPFQIDETAMAK
jgi:hypothetical protein